MRKIRGFKLGKKLIKIFNVFLRRRKKPIFSHRSNSPTRKFNPLAKFFTFGKRLCSSKPGYIRMGRDDPVKPAPKGYIAVDVGVSEGETRRCLVPVIYFNHPLFGKLLQEAEEVYGFNHPGGIVIPCEVSEFENVKKKIAASEFGYRRSWRHKLFNYGF